MHIIIFGALNVNSYLSNSKYIHLCNYIKSENSDHIDLLRKACTKGNIELCKWLHSVYELTKKNATAYNNYAFQRAAERGHLNICKWLYTTYSLTKEDATSKDNIAFYLAAIYRHIKVCEWLYITFNLDKDRKSVV